MIILSHALCIARCVSISHLFDVILVDEESSYEEGKDQKVHAKARPNRSLMVMVMSCCAMLVLILILTILIDMLVRAFWMVSHVVRMLDLVVHIVRVVGGTVVVVRVVHWVMDFVEECVVFLFFILTLTVIEVVVMGDRAVMRAIMWAVMHWVVVIVVRRERVVSEEVWWSMVWWSVIHHPVWECEVLRRWAEVNEVRERMMHVAVRLRKVAPAVFVVHTAHH